MSSGDDIEVRLVQPGEGRLLTQLIRRCYGETCIDPRFYGGVHDYPVTVHAATQRIGAGFGTDTGLMLANMPGDVSFEDMETMRGRRTSSLIRWLPFGAPKKRDVYLPERYRDHVHSTYARAGLPRREGAAEPELPPVECQLEQRFDPRRQTLRVSVMRPGRDLVERVAQETLDAERLGGLVAHVDLLLSEPTTPVAIEALRTLGFFFAGVLPEYRDGDVLRMQRLSRSIEHASGVLSSDGESIEAFVLGDRPSATEGLR